MANRIRYVRKYHSLSYKRVFQLVVIVGAFLRLPQAKNSGTLKAACRESTWADLPHALRCDSGELDVSNLHSPAGALIIPAHNEAAVLGRTLNCLAELLADGSPEVIVVCNGCTDGTVAVAAAVPGVRVIDVPVASKAAALNAGDAAATQWPRIYLDADIELPPAALRQTLHILSGRDAPLCARPAFIYDTNGATLLVRSYYRARAKMHATTSAMWGAGVYGMSRAGHDRLGSFPGRIGDDLWVDGLFADEEKRIVECPPAVVRTPRDPQALLSTLGRVYRGNAEQGGRTGSVLATLRELLGTVRSPGSALDAAVYASFAFLGRRRAPRSNQWERDESTREKAQH